MAMADIAIRNSARAENHAPVKLGEIASRQDIALNYLEQIFSKLKTAGLVNAIKGPGGGYVLAKPASEVTVANIINAVEESVEMTRCGAENREKHKNHGCMPDGAKCVTHDIWEGLTNQINSYLDSISLADICEKAKNAKTYDFIK